MTTTATTRGARTGARPAPSGQAEVLLVVPPFQACARPSLGVSQLKANLTSRGIPARVLYLNLHFAERIGWQVYEWISHSRFHDLIGEFIFSGVLFERTDEDILRYADDLLATTDADQFFPRFQEGRALHEKLRWMIEQASDFCRGAGVDEILESDPWMVGLTSSFQQNCASIALIDELRRRRPDVLTVMGGANCDADMGEELAKRFHQIDFVCQGESDHSFVQLVSALREGEPCDGIPGVLVPGARPTAVSSTTPLTGAELDALPHPDFSDYFAHVREPAPARAIVPALTMETSRGCWWGAVKHCTFCGLNADGMAFRSKSAERVLSEMDDLVTRYDTHYIAVVDNILDMKYFKSVLPKLAERPLADLFFETKGNLTRDQVRQLAASHIKWIQPGVESLSDLTLRLMRKGSTKITNVQLLKWCAEFRVQPNWNFLFGFPGESDDELDPLAEETEMLHHLMPPGASAVLRLDRFSPYFVHPEEYGLEPVTPGMPYRHVYPFPEESLARLAYFYESQALKERSKSPAYDKLQQLVHAWQQRFATSYLVAIPRGDRLDIVDTRRCRTKLRHRLRGLARRVYEQCEEAHSLSRLKKALPDADEAELQAALEGLVRDRLTLHSDGKYLSLAVDVSSGYRKAIDPRGGGYTIPEASTRRLRDDLKRMLTLRMSPLRVGAAVVRRARTWCRRRYVFGLVRVIDRLGRGARA